MGEGFIVRKGGVTTEQALAPTITEVSTTDSSITFTITNNDASTAVILYEVGDTTPDANSIELAAAATSGSLTISGLSPGTVTLYATANVTGKVKSNVTEKEFTVIAPFTEATGGTTLEYNASGKRFRSHTFTSDGTFTVTNVGESNDDRNKVDYLIIAGGGGGGARFHAGGGGAGGYRTTNGTSGADTSARTKVTVTAQGYSIVVGAGGTGSTDNEVRGSSGTASSGLGVSTVGGGGGGSQGGTQPQGGNGGSGGGAVQRSPGTGGTVGTGTAEEGTNGGTSTFTSGVGIGAGGGGGSNTVAGNGTATVGGSGGNGTANLLRTGSNETRAGGGGGGASDGTGGSAGTGGAGTGGQTGTAPTSATANTGSGGGGAGVDQDGGNGAAGIVVIRYEIAPSV